MIEDVSDTAFMVATYRAMETERPDALFRDPLAEKLAGERGRAIVREIGWRSRVSAWSVVVRTLIIDDYIASAVTEGVDTVLCLGAGLDARPYRLALPETLRWIEVDYPRVIELKEQKLASETPRCRLERVALDLGDDAARRKFLAEVGASSKRVLVLTEGVVPYLTTEQAAALADDLRAMPSIHAWIVDYFSPATLRYRKRAARQFQNAQFRFAPDDWFGFFERHGFRAREKRFLVAEGVRRGRPIPLSKIVLLLARLRGVFMTSERRRDFREFAGYVLMEPLTSPSGPGSSPSARGS